MRVFGNVQGVNFRMNAFRRAKKLGLVGEVANEPSGSVLIIAEGPEDKLEALRQWAEEGPESSYVTNVHENWDDATEAYADFTVTG